MTIREEVIDALKKKAAELFGVKAEQLSAETRFEEDLGATSIQYVQFSTVLEMIYDIEVPYMEFRRLKTFAEAADYMAEKVGE